MYLSNTKTIVFITGAFFSHSCWKEWIIFFETKGYKAVAPPWPYKNESAEVLRNKHPNPKIASLRLKHLLDYYIEIIEKLPEKPILIGHSYGGLLTQLLIQKEFGSAGICIHSVPPRGMYFSKILFYKAIFKFFGYFSTVKEPRLVSFKEWQNQFANQLPFEEQKNIYEALIIPESKLIWRDIRTKTAKIDFRKKHPPLLFLSGSLDKITPTPLNYANFKKYKNLYSITCYKEFKNRNHLTLIQQDWQNEAEFITCWLDKLS